MPSTRKHAGRTNGHLGADGLADLPDTLADGGPIRQDTFTTRRGIQVQISGISMFLLQGLADGLREEWAEAERGSLEPPTYDIPLPGGETETRAHDKTTLNTDAERAEWVAYEARVATFARELQERTMRVLLMRGILTDPPTGGEWEAEQKFMGVRIPAERLARRYHWLTTEVLTDPDESGAIMARIMALSGIRGEALKAAEAAFRSPMEESRGAAPKRATAKGRRLVSKPDDAGSKNGKSMGHKA